MPFIQVRAPKDTFTRAQREQLASKLTRRVLEIEVGSATDLGLDISWLVFDDWADDGITVGGSFARRRGAFGPVLVRVTVPRGSLDDPKREAVAKAVWDEITEAKGGDKPDGLEIWSHIEEVADGNWGAAGRMVRLPDIAKIAMQKVDGLEPV